MVKSWQEKYDNGRRPEVKMLGKPFCGMQTGDKMLVSTPTEIDEYIRKIPPGKSVSVEQLRRDISEKYCADGMCPLTGAIFVRIVSELALEKMAAGEVNVTPFWRVVDPNSALAKKLSCGPEVVRLLREKEGIK